jgi:hypothetical protein
MMGARRSHDEGDRRRRSGSRCFSLFFPESTARDRSFPAEILAPNASAPSKNSKIARCFPLFFAVLLETMRNQQKSSGSSLIPLQAM